MFQKKTLFLYPLSYLIRFIKFHQGQKISKGDDSVTMGNYSAEISQTSQAATAKRW